MFGFAKKKKPNNGMRQKTILIVEDHGAELMDYMKMAESIKLNPTGVDSLELAKEMLAKSDPFDIVLTDIHLTDSDRHSTYEGFEVLKTIVGNFPDTVLIAMSSDPKLTTYKKALAAGAWHYVRKPIYSCDELAVDIEVARSRHLLSETAKRLSTGPELPPHLVARCSDGIVLPEGLRNTIRKIAASPVRIPVVIHGETGTGKEEVAKLIHRGRCEIEGQAVPLVAVNCSHLSSEVAMATLFGFRKGSFTGAVADAPGKVEAADGGILFLDEIHTLPINVQQKLLRVLNDGSFERLGETQSRKADFQVFVASTVDLDEAVDNGKFLMDLRGRLTGIDIRLPALRDRGEDLELLTAVCLAKEGAKVEQAEIQRIVTKARELHWPGNIRQYFGVLRAMVVNSMFDDQPITADHLVISRGMLSPNAHKEMNRFEDYIEIIEPLEKDHPFAESVSRYESRLIAGALNRHAKPADAQKAIAMASSSFHAKRKEYGL